LIRNATGLPLVFPLQIRSVPGTDYHVVLRDAENGTIALEAALEGGRFFRVLAPPGQFNLHLTRRDTTTQAPDVSLGTLDFGVSGLGTKAGYTVDLTRLWIDGKIDVRPFNICQGLALEQVPRRLAPFDDVEGYAARLPEEGEVVQHPDARFDPERLTLQTQPTRPTDYAPYLAPTRTGVRNRPC
jgi:hypothetical protein